MKTKLNKAASLFFIFSSILFFSCENQDNNKIDTETMTLPNSEQLKEPPSIITLENTKCEDFDSQINPITQQELDSEFLKDIITISNEILVEINNHRKSLGLIELSSNDTARFLALQHNDYQIEQNKISHDNSLFRSCSVFKLEQVRSTGENVAFGFKTAKSVVEGWLNSPGHKKNIEGDFDKIGIGTTKNENGVLYYTNLFFKDL